jgi:cysteinyl-tRNA synthetase
MDWTERKRAEAEAVLRKWRAQTRGVIPGRPHPAVEDALADDLNTAGAIAELHALSSASDVTTLLASAQLLGLLTDDLAGWEDVGPADGADLSRLDDIARWLTAARVAAKARRDFSAVDAYKRALAEAGVEVRMTKDSVELVPTMGFDSGRLWAIERNREAEYETP